MHTVEYGVELYFQTRLISAPEVVTCLLSYSLAGSTRQVIYINTDPDSSRRRSLKSFREMQELHGGSEQVFRDGVREHYINRPIELENICLIDFVEQYEIFKCTSKVPKSRINQIFHMPGGMQVIAKRNKHVIARWRFLSPSEGEKFYFQKLLLNLPYRSYSDLTSSDNLSSTFQEECYLRGIVKQGEDIDDAIVAGAKESSMR